MEIYWFIVLAAAVILYVILDGFDLGAGIVYLIAAKDDRERQQILRTLKPVLDGNEIWLVSFSLLIWFGFPLLWASGAGGFFLPLIIVCALFIIRPVAIAIRIRTGNTGRQRFLDVVISVSSILPAVLLGIIAGNIVRGVPLEPSGLFNEASWQVFTIIPGTGFLDWYTVLTGLLAMFTLAAYGASYISWQTTGTVQIRARRIAISTIYAVAVYAVLAVLGTTFIKPQIWSNTVVHPWGSSIPVIAVAGIAGMLFFNLKNRDSIVFAACAVFLAALGSAIAFSLYPVVLPSSIRPENSLTVYDSIAGHFDSGSGLLWIAGVALVCLNFIFLFSTCRCRIRYPEQSGPI